MSKRYSAILLVILGMNCIEKIDVSDGFEETSLSKIWSTNRMERRSFEIQSRIIRQGKSAAKITLQTGDMIEEANETSPASERDELEEAEYLESREGIKYEYQFSMFLPADFPIKPTRLIIAQWKQH